MDKCERLMNVLLSACAKELIVRSYHVIYAQEVVADLAAANARIATLEAQLAELEAENERLNAGWDHTSKMLGASNARAYEAEKALTEALSRTGAVKDALEKLAALAERQKAYHNAKQHEFPSSEQCVDEEGAFRPDRNLYALLQGESANGRYSEADWWLCTIRAEISRLSALEPAAPYLCEDEGCPHHGTPHVCVGHPAAPEVQQEPVASETCPVCMGSGYSNHPDSGQRCYQCNGQGATHPSEQAVTEAHKLLLWAADSFEAHAKTADAPDEIDGYLGSAEMYREAASALKAAMEAGR